MKAIEFEGQNLMLMPPQSMERGTCGQLPVCKTPDGRMVSVWKPSAEDIQAMGGGAHVLLHIWGAGHPPVALEVVQMKELP